MFRSPRLEKDKWFDYDIADSIRSMATEAQCNQIDKSKVDVDPDTSLPLSDNEALEYIKSILENCNGALDILGPPKRLFGELKKLKNQSTSTKYLDSNLRTYIVKQDVYWKWKENVSADAVFKNLPHVGNVLSTEMKFELDYRLHGTHEIIPSSWCEQIGKELDEMLVSVIKMITSFANESSHSRSARASRFIIGSDSRADDCVQTYARKNKVEFFEALVLEELITGLFKIFDSHPLVFSRFSDCPPESLIFPLVIRLIQDEDDRFLFVEDVEKAIKWALRLQKRHKVEVNLKSDQTAGRHFCISYSDYLKTLERFGLETNEITLVNVQVQRTSSFVVPMKSPTGTECIPASDAIFSLAKSLLFATEMLQEIKPNRQSEVESAFIKVVGAMAEGNDFMHFIEVSELGMFRVMLRNEIVELIEPSPSKLEPIKISEEKFSYITADRLEETLNEWQFHKCFPSIPNCAELISARYSGLNRSRPYSRLDLCMAVRDCILYCLSGSKVFQLGSFLHNQGICKKLPRFPCECRNRKVEEWKSTQVKNVTVREVHEFSPQSENLENCQEVLLTLMDKNCGRKIVTNRKACTAIFQKLCSLIPPNYRPSFDNADPRKCDQLLQHSIFYITMDELSVLSEDVLQKMSKNVEESLSPDGIRKLCGISLDKLNTTNHLKNDFVDCMKYVMDKLESLTAFQEYLPERTAILDLSELPVNDEPVLMADTKSVIEVVQVMLKQNSAFVSYLHWDFFHHMISSFQMCGIWIATKPEILDKYLKVLPIDLGKLHFVPELDVVANYFRQKLSEIIEHEDTENVTEKAEESGDKIEEEKALEYDTQIEKIMKVFERQTQKNADHIQELTDEIEDHKKHYESLQKECVIKDKLISQLLKDMKDQRKKMDDQKMELINEKKALIGQKQEFEEKKKELKDQKKKLKDQRKEQNNEKKELNDLKKRLDRQMSELEEQKKELEDRNSVITQLELNNQKKEFEDQKILIRQLELKQSDGEKTLKEVNEALEISNELADGLKTENANLLHQRGRLLEVLKTKNREIDEMKKREKQEKEQLHTIQKDRQVQTQKLKEENGKLRRKISSLERLLASYQKTPDDECGICMDELNGRLTRCQVCSTKWHENCIEKWLENKAICPVCSRSLPSSRKFPPLA